MLSKFTFTSRKFWNDTKASVAVEFSLILPILILLYFGVVETVNLLTADRKITSATRTIADLISQHRTENIDPSELDGIMAAATQIIAPFSLNGLTVTVYSVEGDNNGTDGDTSDDQIRAIWSTARTFQEDNNSLSINNSSSRIQPNSYLNPDNSPISANTLAFMKKPMIVVESSYDYKSIFGYTLKGNMSLTDQQMIAPRYFNELTYDGSTPSAP